MCSDPSPRLSILIPCYNTARLIGRCLESLVPLAGLDVEIVIADDCSPDDIPGAVEASLSGPAAPLAPVTHIISNPLNLGSAATRRRLIVEARGKYLLFIDSDDYVDALAIKEALEIAALTHADVVASSIFIVNPSRMRLVKQPDTFDLNRVPIHVKTFSLVTKLLRRQFLLDHEILPFEGINRWEDVGVIARVLALEPKIAIAERPWYYYDVDPARPTLSTFQRRVTIAERTAIAVKIEKWMKERSLAGRYTEFLTALKFYAKGGYLRRPVDVKSWRATFPEARATFLHPRGVPFHLRLAFMVIQ